MKKIATSRKKKPVKQWFPKGWNQERVQRLIDYYDNQTDEEGAAEYETAMALQDQTMILVPKKLVPEIRKLIARHKNGTPRRRKTA
jgi:hypothetical protein